MFVRVPNSFQTHIKRICSVYKKSLRMTQSYYPYRHHFRFHACILRARFDEIVNEKDPRKARQLLFAAEKDLFENQHPIPIVFANSPLGCAYGREVTPPDWVLDYWHPLEKAQYPDYFARREQRKKEYVDWWNKEYAEENAKEKKTESH